MIPIRGFLAVCAIAASVLGGCGKPQQAEAEGKAPPSAAQAQAITSGVVSLGPEAPELKQMTIEPVKAVPVPSDEVTAPARIEANPNRVGHAMLPLPGRVVK